jgi:hypothetical protein
MMAAFPAVRNDEKNVALRTLRSGDVALLAEYFLGLSGQTKQLYSPHSFDRKTAANICASVDSDNTIRFIALSNEGGLEKYPRISS